MKQIKALMGRVCLVECRENFGLVEKRTGGKAETHPGAEILK